MAEARDAVTICVTSLYLCVTNCVTSLTNCVTSLTNCVTSLLFDKQDAAVCTVYCVVLCVTVFCVASEI